MRTMSLSCLRSSPGTIFHTQIRPSHPTDTPSSFPQDQITSMIMAGTKHFKENLKQVGDKDNEECIYEALRLYNSGSMNKADLSDGKVFSK